MKTKHILAFGAHPDDIEFGCAGILIKEILSGTKVAIIHCSLGEAGTAGTPEIRKKEAIQAAKIMGVDISFLDLGGDCHIIPSIENRIKIAKIIRKEKPDILFAPFDQINQHPDHVAVHSLVRDAARYARYGGLEKLNQFPRHIIQEIYYYATAAVTEKVPDILIDISEVKEVWMNAVNAYESQLKNKAYDTMTINRARYFGSLAGVEYAQALWTQNPVVVDKITDIGKSARNF